MRSEVREAGGRPQALEKTDYAPFILNIRYRLENLRLLDATAPLPPSDPVHNIKRYSLCVANGAMEAARPVWRGRSGSEKLQPTGERSRFSAGGWSTYSPEHLRMQQMLTTQLSLLYPSAEIVCEEDFVDVLVRLPDETLLFEIKSDLSPLTVVRHALGQILEYAYHPRRTHASTVRLVIVGRRALEGDDLAYFEALKRQFELPIDYWVVPV
jgi:hypothetical protein